MNKTQPGKGWYIVYIPDQADQIVWRNTYYDLPLVDVESLRAEIADTNRMLLALQEEFGNLQADYAQVWQERDAAVALKLALAAEMSLLRSTKGAEIATLRSEVEVLRRERDGHIRVVEEARYAAVKAKHVAEDEARIARAEADALRNDAEAWQQYKLVQANTPVLAELADLRAANEAFSGALQAFVKSHGKQRLATFTDEIADLRRVMEAARDVATAHDTHGSNVSFYAEHFARLKVALAAAHPAGMTMLDAAKEAASWLASPVATPTEVEALRRERDALRAANEAFSGALQDSHKADARKDAEHATLRAANVRLQAFVDSLGKQKLATEMAGDEYRYADFLSAYDGIIAAARAFLQEPTP
jgi:hypothetical protein